MRNKFIIYLVLIAILSIFSSCQSKEEKMVIEYYKTHLKYPESFKVREISNKQLLTPLSRYMIDTEGEPNLSQRVDNYIANAKRNGLNPNDTIAW